MLTTPSTRVAGTVPWSQFVPVVHSPLFAPIQVNVVGTLRNSSSTSIGRTRRGRTADGHGNPDPAEEVTEHRWYPRNREVRATGRFCGRARAAVLGLATILRGGPGIGNNPGRRS